MRILLITDGIWPYVLGGMQKHSYYLCKYFAQQNIQVHLVHFNQSEYNIGQLEFFSEDEKKFITHSVIPFPEAGFFPGHYIRRSRLYSRQVFEVLKDKAAEFDFIYTKGFTGWHFISQKKKGLKLPPIGVKFHGYEMFQKAPDFKIKLQHIFLLRKPVKFISQNADAVFSYGGKITEIIESIGVDPNKIIEIPSGVENETLRDVTVTPVGKIKFVYLGRYERRKGIEEINSALKKIENPAFEFHFIGPIPDEKKIDSPTIFYHGEIREKNKLNELLRQFDVLVCPSWSEGMPNVILEAMSQGLTVIASDVGATNVLVNNDTGWLIKTPNADTLAKLFQKIASSDSDSIILKKQRALDKIKSRFIWEKLIVDLITRIKHFLNTPIAHTR